MFKFRLCIAGIRFCIETDMEVEPSTAFLPFVTDDDQFDCFVRFAAVDVLPEIPKTVLHQGICLRIHESRGGRQVRSFYREMDCLQCYAVGDYDYENGEISIVYRKDAASYIWEMRSCFFHVGMEALMLQKRRLCFHAACISTIRGGILFTGPSGVGKTTQAQLWCQYRNAKQINGDRPVLSCDDGAWRAWGSPYAGSSQCYVSDSTLVSCIVLLRQDSCCRIRRLSPGEAFRCVYSGVTANTWDAAYMQTACDLIADLIERVPVYEFSCTADEAAVDYLEKMLWKDMTQ